MDFKRFMSALFWKATMVSLLCSSTDGLEGLKFSPVSCNYSGMTLDITLTEYFEGTIYTEGSFFNPACRYSPLVPINQKISFFVPMTNCGTSIRELDGSIYISNKIIIQKHSFVETFNDVTHNVSCILPYYGKIKTEQFLTYRNPSRAYKNEELESWMDFQLGSDILGTDISNKLLVGNEFLVAIHLKDGGNNKGFQVEDCWAYDGETMEESQYVLHIFDNVCQSSDWMSDFNLTKKTGNVSDIMKYSSIKAFKFPATKNLHITCSVIVCKNGCSSSCEVPEAQRSNSYPKKFRRSISGNFSEKNLKERLRLLKVTINALKSELIAKNRSRKIENNSSFIRRVLNSIEVTTLQDYEVAKNSKEYEFYNKISDISESGNITSNSSKEHKTPYERYGKDVYVFNLTNNVVVFTEHEFNFRHEYVNVTLPADCITKLRFGIVTLSLCFISFCLLITCIGLILYLRKEKKKHYIDNFLLYNFY